MSATFTPCSCFACAPPEARTRFFVCAICFNKRCPHARDHRAECVGSNAVEGEDVPVPRPSER